MTHSIGKWLIGLIVIAITITTFNLTSLNESRETALLRKQVEQLDEKLEKNTLLFSEQLSLVREDFQERAAFLEITVAEMRIENEALTKKNNNQIIVVAGQQ